MNPHLSHATTHLNTLSTEHPLHTALATALATYTANSDLTATFVRLLPEILTTSASDFGFLDISAGIEELGYKPQDHIAAERHRFIS